MPTALAASYSCFLAAVAGFIGRLTGSVCAWRKANATLVFAITAAALVSILMFTVGSAITPWFFGLLLALVCCIPVALGLAVGYGSVNTLTRARRPADGNKA